MEESVSCIFQQQFVGCALDLQGNLIVKLCHKLGVF